MLNIIFMNRIKDNNSIKLDEEIVEECFKTNILKYDYSLLSIDNAEIFQINEEKLIGNKYILNIYTSVINSIIHDYNINFCFSFNNTLNVYLNTIINYNKNIPVFFIKKSSIVKKSIYGLDTLMDLFSKDNDNDNSYSMMFPFFFKKDFEFYKKVLDSIKLLFTLVKLKRIVLFSLFDINISDSENRKINQLIIDFKKSYPDTIIINESRINTNKTFEYMRNTNIIDKDIYNKFSMFINKSNIQNPIQKVIQNPLFLYFKDLSLNKKSKVCLSLECIDNITELIKYANLLGPYIVAIRINTNFIYNEAVLKGLKKLADHHKFIIFDDKKIIVKNIEDFKRINLYSYVDVISIKLEFMSEDIEKWYKEIRNTVNKHASFVLEINKVDELEKELITKQYTYFNNFVFGICGLNENDPELFTILNYKNIANINDDFRSLKASDIIVLEDELYKSKNPIEILSKINKITST